MKGFYSPIDQLAAQLPRTKGTGAEFMTELSKRPGYKPQEAQDRELQTLMALPKMERAQFLEALKAKPAPKLEETTLAKSVLKNRGLNVLPDEPTKYEDYSLPGGSNYREILLRMPHDAQRAKEFSDPSSGHWDQPNVLAHVRAKDRTGPNGEKILHLEEIQSDWHQQGRDRGYATPESLQQFKAAQLAHRQLKEQLEEAKGNSANVDKKLSSGLPLYQDPAVRQRMEAAKVEHNNRIMDLMPRVMKAQAEAQDLGHKLNNVVPNAPFKKNWHELALKKMIHHAAANGYDSIAITPGQEQAKRYDLSKQVSRITHMTHHDDPDSGILFAFDPSGRQIVEKHNVPHSQLPEYIGKEGAQKLLGQKPDEHGYRELSGQNLEVGGEGMKGFYDKMIPSFLNQFGKKYGAQVGKIQVPVKHELQGLRTMGGYKDEPPLDLHHFPITPEMREDVTKNGVPLYAKGGSVEDEGDVPRETVKAYKLFRVHPKHPGKLFPLFVDANTPVEMNKWIDAKEGEMAKGKVKSKIGPLAYRPGWHAGDLPIATHIGEKSDSALTAPDVRPENHAWAEVEMPNDVDWQSEATKRGTNAQGKLIPVKAHITDQIPKGGHYRYKTNPNMTGNWLIGGSMRVNRVLADKEVAKINKAAGLADLPRAQPFKAKKFGFAGGGTVGPEEWMAEEHVNHKVLPTAEREANFAKFLKPSVDKRRMYHATNRNFNEFDSSKYKTSSADPVVLGTTFLSPSPEWASKWATTDKSMGLKSPPWVLGKPRPWHVMPVHAQVTNPFDYENPEHIKALNKEVNEMKSIGSLNIPDNWRHIERSVIQNAIKKLGHDSFYVSESGMKNLGVYDPKKIKSAIGNRGTYDTTKADITKAKGGKVKPIGYTKEKVTVSPNLDQMRYELINVKHYVKKVK